MTLRGLLVALAFMTRLPTPRLDRREADDLALASDWLPFVGALIGALVAAAVWVGVHSGLWVGALAGLTTWVLITGALHLDGLGDVADGLGAAHRTPERFLQVLHDPHTGGFGVTAIGLQLIAKLVLLAAVVGIGEIWAIVLVAAWARWGTLVIGKTVPPLAEGLGQRFAGAIDWRVITLNGAVLAGASLLLWPALLAALAIAPLFALYWQQRVGGITGDCHGASIEVTEALLLVSLVAFAR